MGHVKGLRGAWAIFSCDSNVQARRVGDLTGSKKGVYHVGVECERWEKGTGSKEHVTLVATGTGGIMNDLIMGVLALVAIALLGWAFERLPGR